MAGSGTALDKCINEKILRQYLDGTLDDTGAGVLEEHVQECDGCRGLMVSLMDSCAQPMWLSMVGQSTTSGASNLSVSDRAGRVSGTDQGTLRASGDRPHQDGRVPLLSGFAPIRRLGSGSTGDVWEVLDVLLDRAVAVKMLRHASPTAADVQRLMNEAQALGRLKHPGIVRILEVSTRDRPAIIMDLVRGPSLAEYLSGRAIGDREAARLVAELADAIHHAHLHEVIHRDLKPANILLQPRAESRLAEKLSDQPLSAYRPMISDFGTARLADASGITFQGQMLGTPAYMAPEQIEGNPSLITPAVDIYSLGVILYELLTGRPPYVTTSAEATLQLVRQSQPLAPRELQPLISRDLENICLKCLSREVRDRYVTAESLRDDLLSFLDGRPVTVRPLSATGRLFRWGRRNRSLALSLVLVLVLLLGISLQSILFGYRQRGLVFEAQKAEKSALAAEQFAKVAEVKALQSSVQLREQLLKTMRSMDDMVELFGGLDAHDQTVSDPVRLSFFAMAVQAYEDYLAFSSSRGKPDPADVKVVMRVCWLRERLRPGSADESDLAWVTEVMTHRAESQDSEESLDLEARHEEVRAMHAAATGRHLEAAESWHRVVNLIKRLAELKQPSQVELHRHYRLMAAILMNCASHQLAADDFAKAADAAGQAIRIISEIPRDDPEWAVDVVRRLEYSIPLAQLLYGAGQRSRAVATIDRSLSLYADTQFVDPRLQATAGGLQQRLQRLRAEVTGEAGGAFP
ncbi:MAG: protein kinase domain-containing protein [Planctomyces sp.]